MVNNGENIAMPDKNSIIRILKTEALGKPGTKTHAGYLKLMEFDNRTYGEFRKVAETIQSETGVKPFSPSTTVRNAKRLGFLKLDNSRGKKKSHKNATPESNSLENAVIRNTTKLESKTINQLKLNEPLQDTIIYVAKGVDPHKPGIYVFVIEEGGIYVGKYKSSYRYQCTYPKRVKRLLAGEPYKESNPNGFRHIHRALVKAVEAEKKISLMLIENWNDEETRHNRETELINAIGTLNG